MALKVQLSTSKKVFLQEEKVQFRLKNGLARPIFAEPSYFSTFPLKGAVLQKVSDTKIIVSQMTSDTFKETTTHSVDPRIPALTSISARPLIKIDSKKDYEFTWPPATMILTSEKPEQWGPYKLRGLFKARVVYHVANKDDEPNMMEELLVESNEFEVQ